jgi:methionyl-tRNA formyltransferase
MRSVLKILFMGTPALACASLQALLDAPQFEVVGVVTQPDRPKGRDLKLLPSPVKDLAVRRGLPVFQPQKSRDEQFIESIRQLGPDLIAVAAFGQLLPPVLLELPPFGCLNVHTSLLPKYRGAAPIQWAILNDELATGVTIMKMDAGLDTGPILAQRTTPILAEDSAETLHDRLAQLGARLLVETIPAYVSGAAVPTSQPEQGVSHARKIVKEDGLIDWELPARQIWNRVRGLVPWPGAFTYLPSPGPGLLKIWSSEVADQSAPPGEITVANKAGIIVGCGRQALRILSLQREGARRLTPEQFLAGCPLRLGQNLGRRG